MWSQGRKTRGLTHACGSSRVLPYARVCLREREETRECQARVCVVHLLSCGRPLRFPFSPSVGELFVSPPGVVATRPAAALPHCLQHLTHTPSAAPGFVGMLCRIASIRHARSRDTRGYPSLSLKHPFPSPQPQLCSLSGSAAQASADARTSTHATLQVHLHRVGRPAPTPVSPSQLVQVGSAASPLCSTHARLPIAGFLFLSQTRVRARHRQLSLPQYCCSHAREDPLSQPGRVVALSTHRVDRVKPAPLWSPAHSAPVKAARQTLQAAPAQQPLLSMWRPCTVRRPG